VNSSPRCVCKRMFVHVCVRVNFFPILSVSSDGLLGAVQTRLMTPPPSDKQRHTPTTRPLQASLAHSHLPPPCVSTRTLHSSTCTPIPMHITALTPTPTHSQGTKKEVSLSLKTLQQVCPPSPSQPLTYHTRYAHLLHLPPPSPQKILTHEQDHFPSVELFQRFSLLKSQRYVLNMKEQVFFLFFSLFSIFFFLPLLESEM